jgi:murein DD-endopeptidase MepM/ murein hydrolase activator NlpD
VGTDFAVETGTPVTAVSGGTVLRTAETGEGGALSHHTGKGVVIDHGEINGDRMYSYYGHLDEVQVEPGDTVEAGTQIAESGNTGNSTGPHLHLGVYMNDDDPGGAIWKESTGVGFIDPVDWLERKGVDAGQDAPVDP